MLKSSVVAAVLLVAVPCAAQSRGIQPLNADSYQEAAARAAGAMNSPALLRMLIGQRSAGMVDDKWDHDPFHFYIQTPYSTVSAAFAEAKRTYTEVKVPPDAVLTARVADVVVYPGSYAPTVEGIERVVLKRNGVIIQPLAAAVTPTTLSNGFGKKITVTEGRFTFPMAAFAPDTEVTIILIGTVHTFEWTMALEELLALK